MQSVAGGLVRKASRRMFAAEPDKGGRDGTEKRRLTALLAPSEAFPCQESRYEILGPLRGTGQVVASEQERTLAHARWQTNSTLSCAAEPSNLGFGFVPCVRWQWAADTRHKEFVSALGVGREGDRALPGKHATASSAAILARRNSKLEGESRSWKLEDSRRGDRHRGKPPPAGQRKTRHRM